MYLHSGRRNERWRKSGVARPDRSAVDGTVAEGQQWSVSWRGQPASPVVQSPSSRIRTAEAVALGRAVGVDDATAQSRDTRTCGANLIERHHGWRDIIAPRPALDRAIGHLAHTRAEVRILPRATLQVKVLPVSARAALALAKARPACVATLAVDLDTPAPMDEFVSTRMDIPRAGATLAGDIRLIERHAPSNDIAVAKANESARAVRRTCASALAEANQQHKKNCLTSPESRGETFEPVTSTPHLSPRGFLDVSSHRRVSWLNQFRDRLSVISFQFTCPGY